MTSNRPYRKGMPAEKALAEIEKGKGTQFDPEMAEALLDCYRQGAISRVIQESQMGRNSIVCSYCSTYIEIPEENKPGSHFDCPVCHHPIRC